MEKKLGISTSWFLKTYPYNPSLIHMQKIVEGIFTSYGIFVTSIYISEYTNTIVLHFNLYSSHVHKYVLVRNALKLIESLFSLKYNKNIKFDISFCQGIYQNDKLISCWIKSLVDISPFRIRYILKKLFINAKKPSVNVFNRVDEIFPKMVKEIDLSKEIDLPKEFDLFKEIDKSNKWVSTKPSNNNIYNATNKKMNNSSLTK